MSDWLSLYLVFLFLYFTDCMSWIENGSILFYSPWRWKWRLKFATPFLGNERGGLTLLNPLSPFGGVLKTGISPVSLSPDGICPFSLSTLPGRTVRDFPFQLLPFEQVRQVETDGKILILNQERFAVCASPDSAENLKILIQALTKNPKKNREKKIREFLLNRFTEKAAAEKWKETNRISHRLQIICTAFFWLLYLAIPLLMSAFGFIPLFFPAVALILSGAVAIAVIFHRAHRILHPHRKYERLGEAIKMTLFPPAAIRAWDVLSIHSLSPFHPLLLAVMFPGNEQTGFISWFMRDLKYPLKLEQPEQEALAAAAWFAELEWEICNGFLKSKGIDADEFLLPPEPDGESIRYCPRCLCRFVKPVSECPDCPGVAPITIH